MQSKELQKIERIFNLYAIQGDASSINNEIELTSECNLMLLPSQFAIGALREIGYYPSYNMLEYCREKLSMSCKESYCFEQFVSACQMIEEINQVQITRKAITNCLEYLNIHGNNVISRSEFCFLVFDGAEHLSSNECDAILDLLDPQCTNCVSLSSLKKVLYYAHMFVASRVRKMHQSSQHKMSSVASTSITKNNKPDSSGGARNTCEYGMLNVKESKCVDKRSNVKLSQARSIRKIVSQKEHEKESNSFYDEEEEELISISSPSFESRSSESQEGKGRKENDETTHVQLTADETLTSNEVVQEKLNYMEHSDGIDCNVTATHETNDKSADKRPNVNFYSNDIKEKKDVTLADRKDRRENIRWISTNSADTNISNQSNTENMTVKQNNSVNNNNQAAKEFNALDENAKRFIEPTCNNVYSNDVTNISEENVRHSFAEFMCTKEESKNLTEPLPCVSDHTTATATTTTLPQDRKESSLQKEQKDSNERTTVRQKKSKNACCSVC